MPEKLQSQAVKIKLETGDTEPVLLLVNTEG